MQTINLDGLKFGRLTVIGDSDQRTKYKQKIITTICDCGEMFRVCQNLVLNGNTKSCGCIRKLKINTKCLSFPDAWAEKIKIRMLKRASACRKLRQSKIYKEKHRKDAALWRLKNPAKSKEVSRLFYKNNAERHREKARNYRKNLKLDINKSKLEKNRKWHREKYYRNKKLKSNYFFTRKIATRIYMALKRGGGIKSIKTSDAIGCSVTFLKNHLESKFRDGMNWDNYGKFGWHIDHIKPCASFDLSDQEQQNKCFHYTNLQPLWRSENLSKGCS